MGAYDHGNISAIAERRKTRRIHVGPVPIGDGAPVAVQSMTTTQTADVAATLAQIRALAAEGADVVRVAVPDADAAAALAGDRPRLAGAARRRHPLRLPPGAGGPRGRHPLRPAQPGQHREPGPRARGGQGGAGAQRPHPHRRERRLAGGGHRREARLAHRRGDGGERRAAHPAARGRGLPGDQGLAEGPRHRHDRGGEPALLAALRLPAPPRHHRGRHAHDRHHQERRRPGHPARRRHRRHAPGVARPPTRSRRSRSRAACSSRSGSSSAGPR